MTYIDEISGALLKVLTAACDGKPEMFAGYAANAEFWAGEARHCLDVIGGYEKRFRAMKAAVAAHERSRGPALQRTLYSHDLSVSKKRVNEAVRRFLRRCEKTGDLDQAAVLVLCERVGVLYPP